jgi:hypothetical protein
MTEETGPRLGPIEVENLKPGDRFSLYVAGMQLHFPATVTDAYVPSANPDVVRLSIEVPRTWRGGHIPHTLEVYREL